VGLLYGLFGFGGFGVIPAMKAFTHALRTCALVLSVATAAVVASSPGYVFRKTAPDSRRHAPRFERGVLLSGARLTEAFSVAEDLRPGSARPADRRP
jgi:hypothetical protein